MTTDTDTSSKPSSFHAGTATWEDCMRACVRFEAYMRFHHRRWNKRQLEFAVEGRGLVCRPFNFAPRGIVAICIPFGRDASTPSIGSRVP